MELACAETMRTPTKNTKTDFTQFTVAAVYLSRRSFERRRMTVETI